MSRILDILALPIKGIAALFAFLILFVGIWLEPGPPKPEIKKSEFPFTLVYEIEVYVMPNTRNAAALTV